MSTESKKKFQHVSGAAVLFSLLWFVLPTMIFESGGSVSFLRNLLDGDIAPVVFLWLLVLTLNVVQVVKAIRWLALPTAIISFLYAALLLISAISYQYGEPAIGSLMPALAASANVTAIILSRQTKNKRDAN